MSESSAAGQGGSRRWLRVLVWLALIALTIVVLFTTVFPWVEQRLENPTMQSAGPWSMVAEREPMGETA